jgi:nitroreductase
MIADLIKKNRSCRRFHQAHSVSVEALKELVNLARMSASAANRQPLRFILSADPETNGKIFPCLTWAAYLKDWPGPAEGEQPAAYIVILGDTEITTDFWSDDGIAGWSILLGAREKGLAGCFIGAINRDRLRQTLAIDPKYKIMLVIAIGEPAETAVIEPLGPEGSIRYWRDENGVHHVPKRSIDDIIIEVYDERP